MIKNLVSNSLQKEPDKVMKEVKGEKPSLLSVNQGDGFFIIRGQLL